MKEIDLLLARYFSGESSESEHRLLDEWLAESEENEAYFLEMTSLYEHSANTVPTHEPNTEKAFQEFKHYMEGNKDSSTAAVTPKKILIRRLIPYFSIAASFVLLIGISLFMIYKNFSPEPTTLVANENPIRERIFDNVEVLLDKGTVVDFEPNNKRSVIVKKGKVTFFVNSTVSDGEKLLVKVGEVFIEDIGTVFTVIAHNPEEAVIVEVSEGEIHFYSQTNDGIYIEKSGKGIYHTRQDYFEHVVKNVEEIEQIIFKDTSLSRVVEILSTHYGVSITLDSTKLAELKITVDFLPNETLDNVLKIITKTLNIRFVKIDSSTYLLLQ